MIPLGSLRSGIHLPPGEFNVYNTRIHVKKPDDELLKLIKRTTGIFSIFELISTFLVVFLVWNRFCFFFVLPILSLCATIPIPGSLYNHPVFVRAHSLIIATEAIIILGCATASINALQWNEGNGRATAALIGLLIVLIVRFILARIQYKQYDRVRMNRVLSNGDRVFLIA